MVDVLLSNIHTQFSAEHSAREVRSHGRSRADLILFADDELIAVEAKRSDWKRAIFQAALNRYCADRSYVALWAHCVTPQVLAQARLWGLGVLSVAPTWVEIVEVAPATTPNPILRSRLLEHLAGQ